MKNELLNQFQTPPAGYGIVPFFWWLGDPLLKERLSDQLDWLADHHISGLQVNYAHSDKGGRSWGLTYESDPPLFSDRWWELFGWFMGEAQKRGISLSLSDYTLFSPGQEQFTDRVLARHPEMLGRRLREYKQAVKRDEAVSVNLLGELLCAVVVSEDSAHAIDIDVENRVGKGVAPCDGELCVVCSETVPYTYDPMHPWAGDKIIEEFFGMFERHFPGEGGKGLNFFFSDELDFGIGGNLWNDYFADEFLKRKGYDIRPLLYHIFYPGTKDAIPVRMDYYDVIVALEEENYFQKVYQWHEDRHMTYGCDHGGRGYNVVEFGDYMRTQKYNQGPGCDQPRLTSDIVKNKVAASISHLHKRPRVWLEGFYGSGWGTTSEQLTDAIARNYVMGQNLLSLHGLYYSTHGGYWEWAPPCNCFRMPYWQHLSALTGAVERLSYTMTRGVHCCHVGILYPVDAFDGGLGGDQAASVAFHTGDRLYSNGVDFDYLDRESIVKSTVEDGCLFVSGEQYRYLVIPDMRILHADVYEKILEAAKNGLQVVSVGPLPQYGDRCVDSYAKELLPLSLCFDHVKEAIEYLLKTVERDALPTETKKYYIHHRKIDGLDLYMTYGIPKGERCSFKGTGNVVYMNVWDGKIYRVADACQEKDRVSFTMPVENTEFQLFLIGDVQADAVLTDKKVVETVQLDDEWDFELVPTMNNRWGDYELPASDEILPCQVKELTCGDRKMRVSYGTYFLAKEAFSDEAAYRKAVEDAKNGILQGYTPYDFSMRFGIENMPGHQGYHGLKGNITDDFLAIGRMEFSQTSERFFPYEQGVGKIFCTNVLCDEPTEATILTGTIKPESLYVNGERIEGNVTVQLHQGANAVVAGYMDCGRTHLIFATDDVMQSSYPLAMKWYRSPAVLPFSIDNSKNRRQSFTFLSPPAMKSAVISSLGKVLAVTVGNKEATLSKYNDRVTAEVETPITESCLVTIVVEGADGLVGGSLFDKPIRIFCQKGRIKAEDWSQIDGLKYYSGGADYSQSIVLSEEQCRRELSLVLDKVVATAEVMVNGISAGVKVAPSWRWDITPYVKPGNNDLTIRVYNTIGNHYEYIPTRFKSGTASGIIGNAWLELSQ